MAPVTLNNVWMSAQRLPISERKIFQFFGGWSEDPRSVDEIKADIRNSRTENTFFA